MRNSKTERNNKKKGGVGGNEVNKGGDKNERNNG